MKPSKPVWVATSCKLPIFSLTTFHPSLSKYSFWSFARISFEDKRNRRKWTRYMNLCCMIVFSKLWIKQGGCNESLQLSNLAWSEKLFHVESTFNTFVNSFSLLTFLNQCKIRFMNICCMIVFSKFCVLRQTKCLQSYKNQCFICFTKNLLSSFTTGEFCVIFSSELFSNLITSDRSWCCIRELES